ncbi:MAG: hypothetical protein P1U30_06155 [Phycisphaerales bacterium]|nr:hypothetical protein [Phycisphaerales bacterium]
MDTKMLVGGIVGIGLLGVAGVLILGAGSDGDGVQLASASGVQAADSEFKSAYDIDPIERPETEAIETQPRDLQPARGNGRGDGERRGGRRGGFEQMEERLMQFDADGDGILDQAERDAMVAAMRARMTERFDANGDGIVSIEEQFAARREFMLDSRRGERMKERFDADGDGELSEEETAAMNADLDARDAERMAEIVSQYDTDGDGVMSLEETVAMQDQQVQDRRSQMDEFAIQFDEDGDGNLNADERVDAMTTMQQRRELDQFLRRYDTNGDREIGTSDRERFTDAYGKKEPYGDVNRDGIYNMDDVVMFRDMSERAAAANE